MAILKPSPSAPMRFATGTRQFSNITAAVGCECQPSFFSCAPNDAAGSRISDMTLDEGRPVEAGKTYRVAGWASVNPQNGAPLSAVVEKYLGANKTLTIKRANRVTLKGVANNPGIIGGG